MAEAGPATFTFLFTDIEGSTRIARELGRDFEAVLGRHHTILRDAVGAHGGEVERTEGDAFFALFPTAPRAVEAAIAAQRALADEPWPADCQVRVRMGVHTGAAARVAGELVGIDIHRAARIGAVGWGEQIVVSDTTRRLLADDAAGCALRDLGEHRLKDFDQPQRLHQVVAAGLRERFPALRTIDHVPVDLPPQLTGFVGREAEVAEVKALLESARLVTLTGPGGTGKTRLSLRCATESVAQHPDGVHFVELAPVNDPDLVMATVAETLGLAQAAGRTSLEVVSEHLAAKRALLVLDNFEQVLPAAPEVGKLLSTAPHVSILVSSRAPLRIHGEQEYPVPPLPVPDASSEDLDALARNDAVALFVVRARAIEPNFELDEKTAPAVATITRRLEGLPLAIELAAARVRLLPVTAIAERLAQALDVLSAGGRDLPDRQRTLRGAIAWSWDLLDEPARVLFARMSVFVGGATLARIEEVCGAGLPGDVFDALADLVDHSLVRRGDDRFTMLETIREFADEKLSGYDECDEVRARHGEVFLDLLESRSARLVGEDGADALRELEPEHDNLRAAFSRAIDRDDALTTLRLVASGFRLWQMRGHLNEAAVNAARALAMPGVDAHPRELGEALESAGGIAYWQGDTERCRDFYERSLALYREVGDEVAIARGLYNFGFGFWDEPVRGREVFAEAAEAFERLGDEVGVAKANWALGVAAFWLGDYAGVERHVELCLPIFRREGMAFDVAWSLHMRGFAAYGQGRYDEAVGYYAEAMKRFVEVDDLSGIYLSLADFAVLAEAEFDDERSLRLFGLVDRLGERTGTGLANRQLEVFPRTRDVFTALPEERTAELVQEGRDLTVEDAVAYALERCAGDAS